MPFSSVLGASSVIKPGVCTSTTRPTVPYEGQLIYETDTDRVASYNGSAWVYTGGGADLITPSTAFTTSAAVNVNNVFTTAYSGYRVTIIITARSTTLQPLFRMRASGTDLSTAYYGGLFAPDLASAATIYGPRFNNGSSMIIGDNNNAVTTMIRLDVLFPAITNNTQIDGWTMDGATGYGYRISCVVGNSVSYDGFSILTSTGTITGSYSIIGYRL